MSDIVVNDTRPLVQYQGDGVQTVFTYPFPILAAEDLAVAFDDGSTPSGYTVSGVGDSAGGDVTFQTPPAAGTLVTLHRDMPIARTTDFLQAGEFRASAINDELDRLAMMLQQVEALAGNALRRAPEDADAALLLPGAAQRAGAVLSFDAQGLPSVSEEPTAAAARATTAADAAEASEANAASSAAAAATSASGADASATAAGDSETSAAASATAAANEASNAAAETAKAKLWADAAEDSEVEPGLHSARHWAAKAAAVDMAAERVRADMVAVRARQAASAPSVETMPVWALDAPLLAGLDGVSIGRSGSAHVTDAAGTLVAADPDTPRLDHDPATGAPLGLLLEGQRTNELHDSFNPATQTRTLAAGTYTLSVRGSGSCALSGGPTGTASQGAPVTFTLASSTAVTFTVSGSLDAVQCEAGASATSPILTPAGGPATRNAETLTLADTGWIDAAGMSFVIEAHLRDVPAAGALRLFSFDDGTDANRHEVYWTGDISRVLMFTKAAGVSQGSHSALIGAWADGETHRIGLSLGGGQRALYADGAKTGSGGITEPTGLTTLRIARNYQGDTWQGHVRRVSAFPRRLSDADMMALTA